MSKAKISSVWFVPIVAALIGLWMAYQHYSSLGPLITITMPNAEGLTAGKTTLKARSVNIGKIESIVLSDDYSHTVVNARIEKPYAGMLVEDSELWVVKPRVGRGGVSGLTTILSGAYIEVRPGDSKKARDLYQILKEPPLGDPDRQGLRLSLQSEGNKSVEAGTPVNYKGFEVGQIEQVSYNTESGNIDYKIFIESPFDELIASNTKFWIQSAISLKMNTEGLSVQMDSMESLLSGGVTFGLSSDERPIGEVTEGDLFRLYESEKRATEGNFDFYKPYLLFLEESIANLGPDSPVEFRGIRVGSVIEAPYRRRTESELMSKNGIIPILVHIEFERWNAKDELPTTEEWQAELNSMIERGMRATIQTGNLLTGARYIDLDFYDNAPPLSAELTRVARVADMEMLPSMSSGLVRMGEQIVGILSKIEELPLEQTVAELNNTLSNATSAMASFDGTMSKLDTILIDEESNSDMKATLDQLQTTLASYDANSALHQDMRETVKSLQHVLWELKPLLEMVNQKPDSFVFGGQVEDPILNEDEAP
ncbi:intermembrane transport protein PqiB [Neiella marina]|uniref:Intermembrane transport protein PqiB n=1 Tax=Neiella holothuriorum TaxID=2870530 RepID=A0ABS7EDQ3_9GAMM|nr:intermembrane transport protein PqiB [Neiella holothuriorum]MBW8190464.1 intermembrane transport protein PqiB [Neiella holothuriorum]